MKLEHLYVWVNDGEPRMSTPLERGIDEALSLWHDKGQWEWEVITLRSLPCDNREPDAEGTHYPNLCWHYRVTIEGKEEPSEL